MQVITTFFSNEKFYMDNFILWYKTIWKSDKFIFFIGKNTLDKFNYSKNGVNFFISETDNIISYEYISGVNNADKWNFLKHQVFTEIISERHNFSPSLWIDCDEFIYCNDINKVIEQGQFKTHFYEYIPIIPFDFYSDSLWSKCPWYYREQALNNTVLTHDNCKSFCFSPTKSGMHMGNYNGYCNTNYNYDDYDNICFHVGVHSKLHYMTSKHWMQTHPNGIEISDSDRENGVLSKIFDDYYYNCVFDKFNLNLSEKYLKKKC